MTRKQRRLILICGGVGVLAVVALLMLNAFRDCIVFFNSPTDILTSSQSRLRSKADIGAYPQDVCS
jgi:cytochrome c-type biogenesis protein CcmE